MRPVFLFILFISLHAGAQTAPGGYSMPAEWEPHDAVWVGWESYTPFVRPGVEVIKTLLKKVPVKVVVKNNSILDFAKQTLDHYGVDTGKLKFYVIPDTRIWLRDHGGIF